MSASTECSTGCSNGECLLNPLLRPFAELSETTRNIPTGAERVGRAAALSALSQVLANHCGQYATELTFLQMTNPDKAS